MIHVCISYVRIIRTLLYDYLRFITLKKDRDCAQRKKKRRVKKHEILPHPEHTTQSAAAR